MPHRCAFGCKNTDTGVVLHVLPNPDKFPERFQAWVSLLGGKLETTSDYELYKKKRVCDIHFSDEHRNRYKRLNALAVPTLNLLGCSVNFPVPVQATRAHEPTILAATPQAMLEVCIDSLESAINAVHGGADELEVCSSLTEGGLTPSPGLVKQIVGMVNNIAVGKPIRKSCHDCGCDKLTKRPKVNVMIRCRTGTDFHYSVEEMDTMMSDVDVFKAFGVDRFVFGALTETQHIDVINCERLILQAHPTPVTFHRAFDVCMNPLLSIAKIAELGFNRLLTSGQEPTANDVEAIQLIKSLISSAGDKVEIMPGAGINLGNAKTFIDIGCKIVHSSCKIIRYLPQIKNGLSMGTSDSEHVFVTDENIVKKMKEIINDS